MAIEFRDLTIQHAHNVAPVTGALLGAGLGAIAGGLAKPGSRGVLIGAAVGAFAGYAVLRSSIAQAQPPEEPAEQPAELSPDDRIPAGAAPIAATRSIPDHYIDETHLLPPAPPKMRAKPWAKKGGTSGLVGL